PRPRRQRCVGRRRPSSLATSTARIFSLVRAVVAIAVTTASTRVPARATRFGVRARASHTTQVGQGTTATIGTSGHEAANPALASVGERLGAAFPGTDL